MKSDDSMRRCSGGGGGREGYGGPVGLVVEVWTDERLDSEVMGTASVTCCDRCT